MPPTGSWQVPYFDGSADETKVLLKSGGTSIFSIEMNNNCVTNNLYLQLFNAPAIACITLGATVPNQSLFLPKGDCGAMDKDWSASPMKFEAGVVYAVTTTPTGSTGPSACGDPTLNIGYR